MALTADMQIVEECAPPLIVTTARTGKADDTLLLFSDDDALIHGWRREALLPNIEPILHDGTIEELITVRTAIGGTPTFGMNRRDFYRILPLSFSIVHSYRPLQTAMS